MGKVFRDLEGGRWPEGGSILDNVGEDLASRLIGQDPVTNVIPDQRRYKPYLYGKAKYQYGGKDPIVDFESRVGEWKKIAANMEEILPKLGNRGVKKLKQELTSTYNEDIYQLVNKEFYGSPQSNESVKFAQKYLKAVGLYNDSVDGLYGEKTMKAYKQYLDIHSGTAVWEELKGTLDDVFSTVNPYGQKTYNLYKKIVGGE